jgi:hypothetical protein
MKIESVRFHTEEEMIMVELQRVSPLSEDLMEKKNR